MTLYCRITNLWVSADDGNLGLAGPCVAEVSKRPEEYTRSVHSTLNVCGYREPNGAQNRPVTSCHQYHRDLHADREESYCTEAQDTHLLEDHA